MRAAVSIRFSPSKLCLLGNGGLTASTPSIARRTFSSTPSTWTTYGFIGLGRMGYPMAQNLRAKIPESDTLIVHDQKREVTQRFKEEVGIAAAGAGAEGKGKGIEVAETPREVAEKSVRAYLLCPNALPTTDDEHVPQE
ncbi:MAG: hypothetical protein Q9201_003792 [Fulgogasparrea decipioides]